MTLLAYGVNSGLEYLRGENIFKQIEYGIGGLVILILIGENLLRRFVKNKTSSFVPRREDMEE